MTRLGSIICWLRGFPKFVYYHIILPFDCIKDWGCDLHKDGPNLKCRRCGAEWLPSSGDPEPEPEKEP